MVSRFRVFCYCYLKMKGLGFLCLDCLLKIELHCSVPSVVSSFLYCYLMFWRKMASWIHKLEFSVQCHIAKEIMSIPRKLEFCLWFCWWLHHCWCILDWTTGFVSFFFSFLLLCLLISPIFSLRCPQQLSSLLIFVIKCKRRQMQWWIWF